MAFSAHLGLYDDETSARCLWHVPEAHPLEAWGDVRAYDGTARIVQPLIAPLYGGRSAHELLAALSDAARALSATTIVQASWQARRAGAGTSTASGSRACTTAWLQAQRCPALP